MSATPAKIATPDPELLAKLMDWNLPKSPMEHAAAREIERLRLAASPRTMESAPRDGTPIFARCEHSDAALLEHPDGSRLSLYGAHAEGLSYAPTGWHVVVWGGAWDDRSFEEPEAGHLPDWWFVAGGDFEVAANPVEWLPIPTGK